MATEKTKLKKKHQCINEFNYKFFLKKKRVNTMKENVNLMRALQETKNVKFAE